MKKYKDGLKFIFTAILAAAFCGCPPLHYKIFVRNTTAGPVQLTLLCNSQCNTLNQTVYVKSAQEVLKINGKTLGQLRYNEIAVRDSNSTLLNCPPGSTIFLTDLINSYSFFANKSIVVSVAGKADTMPVNYPFKGLKGIHHKRDKDYNFFYRTIEYFDIK